MHPDDKDRSDGTEKTPYSNKEYENHVSQLMPAEVVQTYEVINYISWCLGENFNYVKIDELFKEYGFELNKFKLL